MSVSNPPAGVATSRLFISKRSGVKKNVITGTPPNLPTPSLRTAAFLSFGTCLRNCRLAAGARSTTFALSIWQCIRLLPPPRWATCQCTRPSPPFFLGPKEGFGATKSSFLVRRIVPSRPSPCWLAWAEELGPLPRSRFADLSPGSNLSA